MSLTITATITVADDEAYTAREQAILSAIAAHPAGTEEAREAAINRVVDAVKASQPVDMTAKTKEAADARIAEAKAKAAADGVAAREKAAKAKAAADAKAAAEAKAVEEAAAADGVSIEEPAAAPETAEQDDLVGGAGYTIADAVKAATELVSKGNAAAVKAALAPTGAKKVSELKGDDITAFMTALEA